MADNRSHVLILAEPGCTHDGDLAKMQAMIHVAARAGADIVKFQWTSSPDRMCERRHAPEYLEAYQRIAFPREWLARLAVNCDQEGIEFACTVYLPEDIPIIAPLVHRFKVSSFEANDAALIIAHADHCKPILVSSGMQDEDGLRRLGEGRSGWGCPWYSILMCTSGYPTPMTEMNLAVIHHSELDGLSDHSGQTITGALAVAAGAWILEVHFRLEDCDPSNPDFPHSLAPDELAEYIRLARLAEVAMGDGIKRCMPSEKEMERYCVR